MTGEEKDQFISLMISHFVGFRSSLDSPPPPLPTADELLERLRRIGIEPADIGVTEEKIRLWVSYWGPKAGASPP